MPARLVTVVAPAGFGKTTVINEWIRTLDPAVTVGWLSLDERDVDPVRFWSYLAECVQRMGVSLDDRLVAELRTNPRSAAAVSESIARQLERAGGRRVIVLDDLHRLDGATVVDAIPGLIEAASTTTFVVISRNRPPWTAENARRLEEVLVLTADELAFTLDETGAMLSGGRDGAVVDARVIEAIHTRTEGWPVLVRLAAEDSGRGGGLDRLAADVNGANSAIAGYLTQEVLDRMPPQAREIL
ncbi:MAG: AAA family ATPase, partial [Acidimicrobiia bacterium]|nr:AAA family ATPase [Acidimicrobiia bacterium]